MKTKTSNKHNNKLNLNKSTVNTLTLNFVRGGCSDCSCTASCFTNDSDPCAQQCEPEKKEK